MISYKLIAVTFFLVTEPVLNDVNQIIEVSTVTQKETDKCLSISTILTTRSPGIKNVCFTKCPKNCELYLQMSELKAWVLF